MNLKKLSVFIVILLSSVTQASDEAEYLKFFDNYQTLNENFDAAVSELYSNDAQITAIRTMPDGVEQSMQLEGRKLKEIIVDIMEIARQRGDLSEFSDIKVLVQKDGAKITANRYTKIKCFNDKSYYMIIEKGNNKELKIIAEHMTSPSQSSCEHIPENDIALILQASAKMINKKLPAMLDGGKKLERISSEGNTLTYHYVFVDRLSTDLNTEELSRKLKPSLIQQTCTMPNLKPFIDRGASILHRYNGKDQKQVLEISIEKSVCL